MKIFFEILKNKFGINAHQCNTHKYDIDSLIWIYNRFFAL